jgi:hypothetical protein
MNPQADETPTRILSESKKNDRVYRGFILPGADFGF